MTERGRVKIQRRDRDPHCTGRDGHREHHEDEAPGVSHGSVAHRDGNAPLAGILGDALPLPHGAKVST